MDPNAAGVPPPREEGPGLPEQFREGVTNISEGVSNAYETVADKIEQGTNYVKESVENFGSPQDAAGATAGFLQSNTLIAKFAFLVLVLIAFLFLVDLGVKAIGYFTQPKTNPYLFHGSIDATTGMVISQDPKNSTNVPILRSNNQSGGIEFTWSVWVYINSIPTSGSGPQYLNIFNKGNGTYDASGIATVLNGPGAYIDVVNNQLTIVMNTVASTSPQVFMSIDNLPLRKWFHFTIRMQNTVLDVYINGVIAGRVTMVDVPAQNYENVFICQNGGFNGNLADMRYFNRALSVFEINNIVMWGPNTKASTGTTSSNAIGFPYYLSNLWYNTNYAYT